ncbi:MAG: hypothetical protein MUC42_17665 [Bryobacter sp.]|nr:hypothetical protein [Bryobacter sp.]
MISPDNHWLVYDSNQTGRWEVFVVSLPEAFGGAPGSAGKWQISNNGGSHPVWRADGREIFYLDATGRMMAVPVESAAGGLRFGKPKLLFQTRLSPEVPNRQYDVTADGTRFLIADPNTDVVSPPFTVILNWPKLLDSR